jgi:ABC-type phosphate/phosphonate transport system substrate-binding protein
LGGLRALVLQSRLPDLSCLYPSYEAQVDALLADEIDAAWNTNHAYVRVLERSGCTCRMPAMRDTDRDWTRLALVRAGAAAGLQDLRGKRVGFGESDSPQACILPAHAMRKQASTPSAR